MATKYEMPELREKLVRIVESEWPLTLDEFEDFDRRQDELYKRHEDGIVELSSWPLHLIPEPAAAIALALEFNIPSILPAAYYDISRCSVECDWEDVNLNSLGFHVCHRGKPARWHSMSAPAHRHLLRIQGVINFGAFRVQRSCSIGPRRTCQAFLTCKGIWSELSLQLVTPKLHCDILKRLRDIQHVKENHSDPLPSKLCKSCEEIFLEEMVVMREHVWSKIQEIFEAFM